MTAVTATPTSPGITNDTSGSRSQPRSARRERPCAWRSGRRTALGDAEGDAPPAAVRGAHGHPSAAMARHLQRAMTLPGWGSHRPAGSFEPTLELRRYRCSRRKIHAEVCHRSRDAHDPRGARAGRARERDHKRRAGRGPAPVRRPGRLRCGRRAVASVQRLAAVGDGGSHGRALHGGHRCCPHLVR